MFNFSLCGYPALLVEIATSNYYLFSFVGIILGYAIVRREYEPEKKFWAWGFVVSVIIFMVLFLNIIAILKFFQGDITQSQYKAFHEHLVELNHNNFTDVEKKWLRDFAQCSISNNEISKFEFEKFEEKYLQFKNTHDVNSAISHSN